MSRPQSSICVLGSLNLDLVARCRQLPLPGETISAFGFDQIPGGKGANQAVAAQRAGGRVSMIGRIGDDDSGYRLRSALLQDGIDCDHVRVTPDAPSGTAMIIVAEDGENQIVVVPGANGRVTADDVDFSADVIRRCDILLLQLEVPLIAVLRAIDIAKSAGVRIMLDPAPVPTRVPDEIFQVDVICPNESEARHLLQSEAEASCLPPLLHGKGCAAVVTTRGAAGCDIVQGDTRLSISAFAVEAADATAAGDAFAGAFAVRWGEGGSLAEAARFGNAAGALAASRLGAQPSIPDRADIDRLLASG